MSYRSVAVASLAMFSAFLASGAYAQATCSGAAISDWTNPSKSVTYVVSDASPRLSSENAGDLMSNGDTITVAPDGSATITSSTLKGITSAQLQKIGPLSPKFELKTAVAAKTYNLNLDTPVCAAGSTSLIGASKVSLLTISVGGGAKTQELTLTNVDSLKASTAAAQTTAPACENTPGSWRISNGDATYTVAVTATDPSVNRFKPPSSVVMNDGDTLTISASGVVTPKGPHYAVDELNGSRTLEQTLSTKPPSSQFTLQSIAGDTIYTQQIAGKYNLNLNSIASCSSDGKVTQGSATLTDALSAGGGAPTTVQTLVLTRSP